MNSFWILRLGTGVGVGVGAIVIISLGLRGSLGLIRRVDGVGVIVGMEVGEGVGETETPSVESPVGKGGAEVGTSEVGVELSGEEMAAGAGDFCWVPVQ